jgi:hypothetical protein
MNSPFIHPANVVDLHKNSAQKSHSYAKPGALALHKIECRRRAMFIACGLMIIPSSVRSGM